MSALLVTCLALATPFVGTGIYLLQTRLEYWTQQKHAQD
jgi:hypothetical protein